MIENPMKEQKKTTAHGREKREAKRARDRRTAKRWRERKEAERESVRYAAEQEKRKELAERISTMNKEEEEALIQLFKIFASLRGDNIASAFKFLKFLHDRQKWEDEHRERMLAQQRRASRRDYPSL